MAKLDPAAIKHYGMLNSVVSVKDSGTRDKAAADALGYATVAYEERYRSTTGAASANPR